jgi:hypothetical protein
MPLTLAVNTFELSMLAQPRSFAEFCWMAFRMAAHRRTTVPATREIQASPKLVCGLWRGAAPAQPGRPSFSSGSENHASSIAAGG